MYTDPIFELFNCTDASLMLKSEQDDEVCDATKLIRVLKLITYK